MENVLGLERMPDSLGRHGGRVDGVVNPPSPVVVPQVVVEVRIVYAQSDIFALTDWLVVHCAYFLSVVTRFSREGREESAVFGCAKTAHPG